MRIGDYDELGAGRDGGANLLDVRLPSFLLVELQRLRLCAEVLRQSPGLEVVRHHHGHFVAGLEQAPTRDEVRFGAAGRDEHLIRRGTGVERRAALAEWIGAT